MSEQNSVETLRRQIDKINMQLLDLLNERARLASGIGKQQAERNSNFYDPAREAQMLNDLQMANNGPFSNATISALFKEIFKASLDLEEQESRAKYLVNRDAGRPDTVITLADGTEIGHGDFTIITGPCAVESYEQMDEVAAAMQDYGIKIIRGMAYKPRTSPYDFQGLGEPGLQIARQVANKYGMFVTSEVLDMSLIPMMSDYVDIFWVGARNMQNSYLLRALGQVKQPVILKRSFGATLKEWLLSAEYIVASGNPNVILMERGIRTFATETRNTLDISAVPILKMQTHLPIIVDISHSAGRRDIANTLAKVSVASGADGLMVEVHPNPAVAMSDAKQQLSIPQFQDLMSVLRQPDMA